MEIQYSKRIKLMHALCLAETLRDDEAKPNTDLNDYDALAAADYLSCISPLKAFRQRSAPRWLNAQITLIC